MDQLRYYIIQPNHIFMSNTKYSQYYYSVVSVMAEMQHCPQIKHAYTLTPGYFMQMFFL